jgi:hypothetical protein
MQLQHLMSFRGPYIKASKVFLHVMPSFPCMFRAWTSGNSCEEHLGDEVLKALHQNMYVCAKKGLGKLNTLLYIVMEFSMVHTYM